MSDVTCGTLCRLIEVERIDGRPVKYRVEHGDVGGLLGTVMWEPGHARHGTGWQAWYLNSDGFDGRFDTDRHVMLGFFEVPESAALRMAVERFTRVRESVVVS